ncbi:MAG: uracil-DNA glycosylase family protein [Bacteroidota bacterium]|nr:uracil-DNA glycosylase family protein [Bacteroidota bacterium]
MENLIKVVHNCLVCKDFLPYEPKPIFSIHPESKILIIGQAPGQKVQNTGIPWNDLSGNELRRWLGIDKATFYNNKIFSIMPMGFCFPGTGKSGDLPPRSECAPLWHSILLQQMKKIELTILIGQYSQKYYLGSNMKPTLTETVNAYKLYLPQYFPIVHPSPRNIRWQKRNPLFENEIIPVLQQRVANII